MWLRGYCLESVLPPIIACKVPDHDHVGLLSDEALLHNIAHGCEECFTLLFLRLFRPLLSLACKILRDRSEAEDLVQEVFLAVHEQSERFDPALGNARTWVLQFGYYKSIKRRRYLRRRHFYDLPVGAEKDNRDPFLVQPEFIQRSVEAKELIGRALETLSPAQRRVVELLHFEGHTLREISEQEGKQLGATRNTYYRGLKTLKSIFAGEGRSSEGRRVADTRKKEYEIEL